MTKRILALLFLSVPLSHAALVTRYFDDAGNGAADGTTWATRAPFLNAGVLSTIITGFNFSGSDAMLVYVEGGNTYTLTTGIGAGSFANPPTALNQLTFHGCDSSGDALTVPDPDWTSAEPPWTDTTLPIFATTTNITTSTGPWTWRLFKFTTNARIGTMMTAGIFDWCVLSGNTSNTSAITSAPTFGINSVFYATGTSYDTVLTLSNLINCRVIGNPSASSGNRAAMRGNAASAFVSHCTFVGNVGSGIENTNTATTQLFRVSSCVFDDIDGVAIRTNNTASQTQIHVINRCVITNCGTAIDLRVSSPNGSGAQIINNRFRDNSTNFTDIGNSVTSLNYTTDDDNDEYADHASGDYRIANDATIWANAYGVADEPSAGGGGGETSATFSD